MYLVTDDSGTTASFGPRQAQWLADEGLVELERFEQDGAAEIRAYRITNGETAQQISDRVLARRELRECDFCRAVPTDWIVKVRPFKAPQGLTPFPTAEQSFKRSVYACDICVQYVRSNDKAGLVDRTINETVRFARDQGGVLAAHVNRLSMHQIRAGLSPMVREFVMNVFANRQGYPERDEDEG